MKRDKSVFIKPVVFLLTVVLIRSLIADRQGINSASCGEIVQKIRKLQIPFVANEGQADERVAFYASTWGGGTVFITKKGEIVYILAGFQEKRVENASRFHSERQGGSVLTPHTIPGDDSWGKTVKSTVIKEKILKREISGIKGEGKSSVCVNYFRDNTISQWKTTVSAYDGINLGEVYEGIELRLKAYGNTIEKLFSVKPGARPEEIKINMSGANSLRVNEKGELEVETVSGTAIFTKPIAYQEINGKRINVEVAYYVESGELPHPLVREENPESETLDPKLTYGFKVGAYDVAKELIIDPLLASTYLGGSSGDVAYATAMDADENIYVTGWTRSSDFPGSTGEYRGGGYDAFVAKFNKDLTNLLACTYLGGNAGDYARSLTIDPNGDVYVAGWTESLNFPTTPGAFDTSYNGGKSDIFVSKLTGDLTKLLVSSYLGGTLTDIGEAVLVDKDGNILVSGETDSPDFPVIDGSYDTSFNNYQDVFVSKFNIDLTRLLASTYLGGRDYDYGSSASLDLEGNIFITGSTWSSNFPTTSGSYDASQNGFSDAFIAELSKDLKHLLSSTYLGGSKYDYGQSIVVDADANVSVVGYTYSKNFPTSYGAYDTSYNGHCDIFISRFPANLTSLLASTYLGGTGYDYGESIAIDFSRSITRGNIYVAGYTTSPDFPITMKAFDTSLGGHTDAFVSNLKSDLKRLVSSTYLGGSLRDYCYGRSLSLDKDGNVYVAGWTESANFPSTPNAYDTSHNKDYDAFVSKFDNNLSVLFYPPAVITGSASNVTAKSVTLRGTVNANGLDTVAWFEYSTENGMYNKTSSKQTIIGSSDTSVSIDINGLQGASIYYYRLVAQNEAGTTYGRQSTFSPCTDPYEPNDTIDTAYGPILSSSSYYGKVCSSSDVDFFKIELVAPGRITLSLDVPQNKDYDLRLYDPSRALIVSTSYTSGIDHIDYDATTRGTYYIEVLSHAGDYDEMLTYSLLGTWPSTATIFPPTVTTGPATNVTPNTATMRGTANANLTSTSVWFEYGTTPGSYSNTSPARVIEGSNDTSISIEVSGLSSGATYYYRIAAKNNVGVAYGIEGSFITGS